MVRRIFYFTFLILLLIIQVTECKRKSYFVYNELGKELILAARGYGATVYEEYINATENLDPDGREAAYPDFFEKCNDLGWEFAENVTNLIKNTKDTTNVKTLKKIGLDNFLAKFLTLENAKIKEGIKQLCMKTELQFQCQFGFGESRSQIQLRIENLKKYDGDMRLLLEKDCNENSRETLNYPCIGHATDKWTAPCIKIIDDYNLTRSENNDKIYKIYTDAIDHAEKIVNSTDPDDSKQFIPTKIIVQNILKKALNQILELESEKCRKLSSMISCISPEMKKICRPGAADAMKISLLVGYLRNERGIALQTHFEQFDIDPDPICLALHKDI
jgi:hypothetical protein